jgi:hypothetical protein
MQVPKEKKEELKREGKPDSSNIPGGRAAGRLHQFQYGRGVGQSKVWNQIDRESAGTKKE